MSLEYAKKLNVEPSECSCEKCKLMCHAPCCGSVEDMERLIDAGYAKRLMFDDLPSTPRGGDMLKPALKGHEGKRAPWETFSLSGCTFWKKGKCELHNKNLKPIQGRLAIHESAATRGTEYAKLSQEDWESERGLACIERWKKEVGYVEEKDDN